MAANNASVRSRQWWEYASRCLGAAAPFAVYGYTQSNFAFCENSTENNMVLSSVFSKPPKALDTMTEAKWWFRNQMTSVLSYLNMYNYMQGHKSYIAGTENARLMDKRKVVVVAGGGWAAVSFMKVLDPRQYRVVWISQTPIFSFTPLLPSVCGGVLSPSAVSTELTEFLKVGKYGDGLGTFISGCIDNVDTTEKTVTFKKSDSSQVVTEKFDYLVLSVGSDNNTFNIKGVEENALFLKSVQDAVQIRKRLADNLVKAATDKTISDEERARLLTFVFVGGGPTGVETAAEIQDYLTYTAAKKYPHIAHLFRVVLVEMLPNVLGPFSQKVQKKAAEIMKRNGIELMLESQVTMIGEDGIHVTKNADKKQVIIPSGLILWASGVKQASLAAHVAGKSPAQNARNRLLVDPSLRVLGCDNVFAMGDCAFIQPPKLEDYAENLFSRANEENAQTQAGTDWLQSRAKALSVVFPQISSSKFDLSTLPRANNLKLEEFKDLLKRIDSSYRSPVPTAQNAKQEGHYLGILFNQGLNERGSKSPAFVEHWAGSCCFLGGGNAALETPQAIVAGGMCSSLLWKAVYLNLQFTVKSSLRCVGSWFETFWFGRNIYTE